MSICFTWFPIGGYRRTRNITSIGLFYKNLGSSGGKFKDDKPNGQGTHTYSDGGKYVGEWKNGKEWNGTEYDKDGNIEYKVVNGELQE